MFENPRQVVREKIFRRLRSELPYRLSVDVLESRQFPDGSLLVKQEILVPTETVSRLTSPLCAVVHHRQPF